jgi:predicted ester cyclase
MVVVHYTATGTHQGELAGIAPTGKRVNSVPCPVDKVNGQASIS